MAISAVSLPVGTETELGRTPGAASVTLSRTVTPNAVSAPALNSLDSRTTVVIRVYATQDGTTWYQAYSCPEPGGVTLDAHGGAMAATQYFVSIGPGEVQMKVTAQPVSAAAVSHVGCQVTI